MENQDLKSILYAFGLNSNEYRASPIGNGLIHSTYVLDDQNDVRCYILQHLNHQVFQKPEDIAWNLGRLKQFLEASSSDHFIPFPIQTTDGSDYAMSEGKYFRLSPFVPQSHAVSVCDTPEQAYEAAFQFGNFTAAFKEFNATELRHTIPRFHDLLYRWEQFTHAVKHGDADRINASAKEIDFLSGKSNIVRTFEAMTHDHECRLRVTHHDTKISNVLFDEQEKGICVIDLDTVMPGYHISDLGDMYRTYLSPASEEVNDLDSVYVRKEYMEAIRSGYLDKMSGLLTEKETSLVDFAGSFMIYMQALRFLADHLNRDVYYGARYEGHNLARARNQIHLLQAYEYSLKY
jgi:Ser/Thr protein kinase RdoA (MazF antagonist)